MRAVLRRRRRGRPLMNVALPARFIRYFSFVLRFFYRAMLCIRGTSHGPVSVCPCPPVTSWSYIETDERIGLVFGMGASFDLSYTVL